MTLTRISRTLVASFSILFTSLMATAQAPPPNTTEWDNETPYNLRLFYPSDLDQTDPAQVMQNGQFTLFGISGATDPTLAQATRCLRPILLLHNPQSEPTRTTMTPPTPDGESQVTVTPGVRATILLAELDVACLSLQQSQSTNLLFDMAEIVDKVPGMRSIAQPSTYTIGYQKVHMAAAQGQPSQPETAGAPPSAPNQLFTMAISTNWHSHLLVWYFSSNSIDTLNRITKTTVRFGRAQAAPLYPVTIGTGAH